MGNGNGITTTPSILLSVDASLIQRVGSDLMAEYEIKKVERWVVLRDGEPYDILDSLEDAKKSVKANKQADEDDPLPPTLTIVKD